MLLIPRHSVIFLSCFSSQEVKRQHLISYTFLPSINARSFLYLYLTSLLLRLVRGSQGIGQSKFWVYIIMKSEARWVMMDHTLDVMLQLEEKEYISSCESENKATIISK
jgi:hypothetical protein